MPIYEYECTACGKLFDVIQRITDPPLEECSDCGGRLKKQISLPTVIVKSKSGVAQRLSPKATAMLGSSNVFAPPLDFPGRLIGVHKESNKEGREDGEQ